MAIYVASLTWFASLVVMGVLWGYLGPLRDRGLALTTSKACTAWSDMGELVRQASALGVPDYDTALPMDFTDQGPDPNGRLLERLLRTACCTEPTLAPGVSPFNRSRGCACITTAYWNFALEALNVSQNITEDVREHYASDVVGCMRYRPVYQVRTSTRVHPVAVALYANTLLFLCSFAFFWFTLKVGDAGKALCCLGDPSARALDAALTYSIRQLVLLFLAGTLVIPFVAVNMWDNIMSGFGLVLVVVSLLITLNDELAPDPKLTAEKQEERQASSFRLCLLTNLQLLIPAYVVNAATGGLGRDLFCVYGLAIAGCLVGIAIRTLFWIRWHGKGYTRIEDGGQARIANAAFAALVLYLLFVLLVLVVYADWDHTWLSLFKIGLVVLLILPFGWENFSPVVYLYVFGLNLALSVMAIVG